jgi:hypothetical protein
MAVTIVDAQDFTVALKDGSSIGFISLVASTRQQPPRCIGLRVHSGQVLFRHIQWKAF